MNGSPSCYITVKRLAFFPVETILARTIHISNDILNWFWALFKNVDSVAKRQEKGTCWIFKRILRTWHTDSHCGHWKSFLPREWNVFLCRQSLREQFVFGQYTSHMGLSVLLSYPQSGVNALNIIIALNYFTLVCSVIWVPVKMVKFTMVKVDNFCKKKLIAV